jgi:hypothetical protein
MTYTDKHIVATYSSLFEGLSSVSKIELIESLTKSLKKKLVSRTTNFINLLEPLVLVNSQKIFMRK